MEKPLIYGQLPSILAVCSFEKFQKNNQMREESWTHSASEAK
jgi:hypothetical protein